MNQRTGSFAAAILIMAAVPAAAQWPNVPTKGVPRAKDGKLDLSAPAPRKPDGKPDLSGIWRFRDPQDVKYLNNLASDFKPGGFPIQPWAEALTQQRMTDAGQSERPSAHCLPNGVAEFDTLGQYPFKIIQESDLVVILYEAMWQFRQVFLDGRMLPKNPNPTWLGYSVGRWEGDVLVVDTAGFNGKAWLDEMGHPTTDALQVTERFRRRDFGHLELTLTIDDPRAYTKPWSVDLSKQLAVNTELLEFVCNENNRDLEHLVGK